MNKLSTLKLVHLAMIGATVIYAVVGLLIGKHPMEGESAPLDQNIVYIFLAVAVMATLASFVIPGIMMKRAPDSFQLWFTSRIVAWGLAETVAIIGLIVYLIDPARPQENLFTFVGWACVLMAIHTPRNPPAS